MIGRRWLSILALTVAPILATTCGPAAQAPVDGQTTSAPQQIRASKRVVAAIKGEPKTLSATVSNIGSGQVQGSGDLQQLINTSLYLTNESGAVLPGLAEQIPTTDNGLWRTFPDGTMETVWKTKPGAQWHDRVPFTAEDLSFTAEVQKDPEVAAFREIYTDFISSVATTDSTTLTLRWNRLFIRADRVFDSPLPKHLLAKPFADSKASFTDIPYWTEGFVGTGPFRLKQFVASSHVILQANDAYVFGRPKIDEMEVRFIPDPNTMVANVLAGEVNLTLGTAALTLQAALQVRDAWADGRVDVSPIANFLTLYPQFLNPDPPVIADVRFRRALLHAVDRQELVDTLEAGLSTVAHSVVSPRDPEYQAVQTSIVRYEYDPSRAAEMIEALGYTRRGDGWFYDANNRKLSIPIQASGANAIQMNTMFPVADYWQRAGVAVTTLVIPPQRDSDRGFHAERPGFELPRQFMDLVLRANSSREIALPANNYRGINRARYVNPEYDALLDRYYVTIPWNDRMEVLRKLIHHLTDQLPVMTLFYDVAPALIDKRLTNVNAFSLWNVQEWDVR